MDHIAPLLDLCREIEELRELGMGLADQILSLPSVSEITHLASHSYLQASIG